MAPDEWKAGLTASARYENIERIASAITAGCPGRADTAQQEAFKLESQAFDVSPTRQDYDQACLAASQPSLPPPEQCPALSHPFHHDPTPGLTIGHYTNCVELDEGITSTVYRSPATAATADLLSPERGYALKLIHHHPPEPHNPTREIKTLQSCSGHATIIPLLETFHDGENHLVLVFPLKPLTLSQLLDAGGPLPDPQVSRITRDVLSALEYIHERGIVHRDLKPSAVLLDGPDGPAYLSDFGTVWHPEFSPPSEPADSKILDIGTGPYRPPDALMGNKSYSTPIDIWSLGVLLSELASLSPHPTPIFSSPPTHEDGSQLGLILSIFRTLGTPTLETWPEAAAFRTSPFGMWRVFEAQEGAFDGVSGTFRELVVGMLKYESGQRLTAKQALEHKCLSHEQK
ncbi:related to cyclin-supressing protein kinase [Cephalotrichum gorgonifer]|uniref:cyclin-dependent kinase n=1 Tax=Cephalotrichum gorgonifer TaxID=2041049 RepID=A0AAE8MRP7_9PEZI|nr:related to cyclin-supressing protein kinase [Cephalotrichum gorgonifer]